MSEDEIVVNRAILDETSFLADAIHRLITYGPVARQMDDTVRTSYILALDAMNHLQRRIWVAAGLLPGVEP